MRIRAPVAPIAIAAAFLLAACGDQPTGPELRDSTPQLGKASAGAPVESVTGGGRNIQGGVTEWISLSVHKNAAGEVRGNYEYGNEGIQNWRYHGVPECLAVSADGTRAVVIGPVTIRQPDGPALGTLVGFLIVDGGKNDSAFAFFAGSADCAGALNAGLPSRPTSGNYTIRN